MLNWVQSLDGFLKQARIRYLGLGLLLAWVYASWFSDGIFAPNSAESVETLRVSLAASAVGLLVLAFRPTKRKPLASSLVFSAAIIVSVTTLLFFVVPNWALFAISALGGLASSVLWVAWGELFCQIDAEITESCIPASLAVFVVAVLLTFLLPTPVSGILAALYPLASSVMLLLGKNSQSPSFAFETPTEPFKNVLPTLVKLAFCSMVCSAATGCVVTSFQPDDLFFLSDDIILSYVAGGALAGCIAAFAIAHARRLSFSFLYEWAIPLIVFSLSLRIIDNIVCNTLASILASAAALYVEVLFFAIFARITAKGFCLPSETFGIFRSVVQLGFLIGAVLGTYTARAFGIPVFLALICLCVVMLPLFLHLQRHFEVPNEQTGRAFANSMDTQDSDSADSISLISTEYKLSPREIEVLRYLAKGRSVPYMREAMTLSKSTIETHIKHIYSKTDVHSKQELIDLIESFQSDIR